MMGYAEGINFREEAQFYIPALQEEIDELLNFLGEEKLSDLFKHIPKEFFFSGEIDMPLGKGKKEVSLLIKEIAEKNKLLLSFLTDSLNEVEVPQLAYDLLGLRSLTTSYTPYQPERSQGTLISLWIYQCVLSELTGFEAINSSFYDRSTAIFESMSCAYKFYKGAKKHFFVFEGLYSNDIEVIETHCRGLDYCLHLIPMDIETGLTSLAELEGNFEKWEGQVAGVIYPQINNLGLLEDVNKITDLVHHYGSLAIAVIDPFFLAMNGLKSPYDFGRAEGRGADMFVGEAQHLACPLSFGGPGLGIFGTHYNEKDSKFVRNTAGRYVGKAKDEQLRDVFTLILSTREQHIRREKANSNICSNQAYLATILGGVLLNKGSEGLAGSLKSLREKAEILAKSLLEFEGVELKFPSSSFFNEFILKLNCSVGELLFKAKEESLLVGLDISDRLSVEGENLVKISVSDVHTEENCQRLISFFQKHFNKKNNPLSSLPLLANELKQKRKIFIPKFSYESLLSYYKGLCHQNISPDNTLYPLGSCTMKYNPYLNDYTASFKEFLKLHPQSPEDCCQGSYEVLYLIQEYFKAITGLSAVTTQPVAGAQGELVGLKMFQAYHRKKGEVRDIIFIPRSAHGTNPATAATAGFFNQRFSEEKGGIIFIDRDERNGEIDFEQLEKYVKQYGNRISSIMITNPNTNGIFERDIKKVSDLIHGCGGFVYMDGANMNAIAGWVDLSKLGIDAVHNNLHKTWSIPHGGGGPGDAIVAVSEKLVDFLPGYQIIKKEDGRFTLFKSSDSIGSFHRHFGNFMHKVRCLTYLSVLGRNGIKKMSAMAVLSARYLYNRLKNHFKILPETLEENPIMHEFIIALPDELIREIESIGLKKSMIIGRVGKLFLDFGFHAPTVSFPEPMGLMIEPTESYTKSELDRFADATLALLSLIKENPKILLTVPHFTPIGMIDELSANKYPIFSEKLQKLPKVFSARKKFEDLTQLPLDEIKRLITKEHYLKQQAHLLQ